MSQAESEKMSASVGEAADPPAGALVEALRGLGYNLPTALADLIDNSISAGAANVWLDFHWAGQNSFIRILDDGRGMDETTLRLAMRPGSRSPAEERAPEDLGRFGLGLKTASFSQCRRLTVGSRRGGARAVRRWDLDHVVRANRWELLMQAVPGSEACLAPLDALASGTAVLWEQLDRVVGDVHTEDAAARGRFLQQVEEVERHLAMVFHRYLDGAAPRLRIFLNGRDERARVRPWDPFLSDHQATWTTPREPLSVEGARIEVQGYVLPHKDRLDERAFAVAGGPSGWNAHQGFFVYRNRRLLVPGGWLGLGSPRAWPREEHYKLARIRIDIPNSLDQEWKIDVRKSTARPPEALRPRLRDLADDVRKRARKVFLHRGGGARGLPAEQPERPWRPVETAGRLGYRISRDHPLVQNVLERSAGLKPDLLALLRLLEETVPVQQIWLDMAERPEVHARPFASGRDGDEDVRRVMTATFQALRRSGLSVRGARDRLYHMEPFNEHPEMIESLNDDSRGGQR